MSSDTYQTKERCIQELTEEGKFQEAAEQALTLYSGELFGFLMVTVQDEVAVQDVFQHLSLEMWKALPKFEWRSSLRTWLYILARSTLSRYLRDPNKRRFQALSTQEEEALPERHSRTATQTWRKTESKSRLWLLCAQLPVKDRELLMLRISRKMTWPEIVQILGDHSVDDKVELRKASARLRKQYERLKNELREQITAET